MKSVAPIHSIILIMEIIEIRIIWTVNTGHMELLIQIQQLLNSNFSTHSGQ